MQLNGSFKVRSVLNQSNHIQKRVDVANKEKSTLFTFSAGNYGKAFAFLCAQRQFNGKVLLSNKAALSRIKYIESQGVQTQTYPPEELLNAVEEHSCKDGFVLLNSIDDYYLVVGYATMAKEILKQCNHPDIVLVCCGGGSLVAGIATGLSLNNCNAIVYGVEPEGANTMYQSYRKGYPVKMNSAFSCATGLSPPFAGTIAFNQCKQFVKDILLVTDDEIKSTCKLLFEKGLKVELSGCAAICAVLNNKIPKLDEMSKELGRPIRIVTILSGGNVSADEMAQLFNE
jgi:threonine dehydratase